jgi:peptidoglycan/xylan/chitin deacetylase (PgdA/CDA1 family)
VGILLLGAGVVVVLHRSESAVRALTRLLPADVLCYVDTNARAFALTFDDGPDPDITPLLLDVLARHHAKATFFLIGERIPGNESIVARIASEGHELANHLMHDEPSVLLTDLEFRQQLGMVTSLLAPYGSVRWFRPGSGWVTPRMLKSAAQLGLHCVLGTAVAVHSGGTRDSRIARHLLGRIRPGSIAVLHEGMPNRRGVVTTTDLVLTEIGRRGLVSVTISELTHEIAERLALGLYRRAGPGYRVLL